MANAFSIPASGTSRNCPRFGLFKATTALSSYGRKAETLAVPEDMTPVPSPARGAMDVLASFGGRRPIRNLKVEDGEVWPAPGDGLQRARAAIRDALWQASMHSYARFEAKAKGEDPGRPRITIMKTDPSAGKTKEAIDWMQEIHEKRPTVPYVPKEGGAAGEAMLPTVYAGPSWKLGKEVSLRMFGAGHEAGKIGFLEGKLRAGEAKNALVGETGEGEEVVAGCRRAEEMRLLMEAGLPTHNLCRAKERVVRRLADGSESVEWEWTECPHFRECEAQRQKRKWNVDPLRRGIYMDGKLDRSFAEEAAEAVWEPVCVTVHAFADRKSLPHLVRNPRLVVIDEDVTKNMRNRADMPETVLREPRRPEVALTKTEREEKVKPEVLMADYAAMCRVAFSGLAKAAADSFRSEGEGFDPFRACPVESMLLEYAKRRGFEVWRAKAGESPKPGVRLATLGRTEDGEVVVEAAAFDGMMRSVRLAKRVSWGSVAADQAYGPGSTVEQLRRIAERPKAPHAATEWRMWKVVEERLELLAKGEGLPREETRIRLKDGKVRISWRSELAWKDTDVVLLDASADEAACRDLFPDHEIVFVDCSLAGMGDSLPIRVVGVPGLTLASSSLVPSANAAAKAKDDAAGRSSVLKKALDAVVMCHAGRQVLVGSTTKVERGVMADWVVGGAAAAANRVFGVEDGLEGLDSGIGTGHFGAFRGVDEHKGADAVVSVGKLEFPDEVVEDFAICDSYDKPRREGEVRPAFKGDESNPKAPETRRLRRRQGGHYSIPVWTYRCPYMRRIQLMLREEEIVQLVGRCRPALRDPKAPETWPVAWIMGNVFPDNWIYDDFIDVRDLSRGQDAVQAAVVNGGCMWAEAAVDLGLAACLDRADPARRRKTGSDYLRRSGFGRELPTLPGWAKVAVSQKGGGQPTVVHVWLGCLGDGVPAEEAAAEALRASGVDVAESRLIDANPFVQGPPSARPDRPSFGERCEAVADAVEASGEVRERAEREGRDAVAMLPELAVELALKEARAAKEGWDDCPAEADDPDPGYDDIAY